MKYHLEVEELPAEDFGWSKKPRQYRAVIMDADGLIQSIEIDQNESVAIQKAKDKLIKKLNPVITYSEDFEL
jgi:hypothetical protein